MIDAAYAEYVTHNDYAPGVELVDAGDNVVTTRTFSKIYAMGGCDPVGHTVWKPWQMLNRIRPPFSVTSGAQAAGIAAVNIEFLTRSRDHNTAWQPWLSDRLGEMGLDVVPSRYCTIRFRKADPHSRCGNGVSDIARDHPTRHRQRRYPEALHHRSEEEMRTTVDVISGPQIM